MSGAILAIGRGGRKAILWSLQKDFYEKKLVILCPQTNLTDELREVLCQIQQEKLFEGGLTSLWVKTEKSGPQMCQSATFRGITPTLRPISRMAPACGAFSQNYTAKQSLTVENGVADFSIN